MTLALRHLPADVLETPSWALRALAERPRPADTPGVIVPASAADVPPVAPAADPDERMELARTLEEALGAFAPHVAVLESARRLADPRASLVMVGQQPGLLGGPLFNAYKALHAVRLARELEAHWGTPVIPAFWNHADDHDVAEVHHLWIQNPHLDIQKVGLKGLPPDRRPLGSILLDEERHKLGAVGALLRQNLAGDDGERDAAVTTFLPRHGESLASAFTRVQLDLFGHLGLVVVEPEWIRGRLSQVLARVVGAGVAGPLEEGARAVQATGSPVAIDPGGAALVFHIEEGRRRALRLTDPGDFSYDGEAGSRTATELAAEIVQAPEAWSAGALLRPLVQDLALPVAAYVGGWGELAYHRQLPPLRRACGAPEPVFVPRLSATLVDEAVRQALEKTGVDPRQVLEKRGLLTTEDLPDGAASTPGVVHAIRDLAERTADELRGLRDDLAVLDTGLASRLRQEARRVHETIGDLAERADRVAQNRAGRGKQHLRRLNNGLFPREKPQERVRGCVEFVAGHGRSWLDALLEEIDPFPTEHLLVYLREEAPRP